MDTEGSRPSETEAGAAPDATGSGDQQSPEQQNDASGVHQADENRENPNLQPPETPTPEREIPRSTLIEETRTATHAAVGRQGEMVHQKRLRGETGPLTYDEQVVYGVHGILASEYNPEKPGKNFILQTEDGKPIDPLNFNRGDKALRIISAVQNPDGTFNCMIEDTDPSNSDKAPVPKTFTREALADFVITTDARTTNAVLNKLPESQRELARLHINVLENGESALDGKTPEQISQMINKVGKETNLLTMPEMRAKASRVPESQRQEFLDILEGRNLVTGETLNRFLQMTDVSGIAAGAAIDLRSAEAALKENPNSEDFKEAVDVAREYLKRFNEAAEKVKSGELRPLMERFAKGNVDSDTALVIKNAIVSDNLDAAADALFPDLREEGGSPEDIAKKARKRRETKKKLQMAGGGLGILAILLLMAGAEMTKTMASQK